MQNLPARTPTVKTSGSPEADRRSRSDRLAERETIIRFDDAGQSARVYTCHRGLAASLLRRGVRPVVEIHRGGRIESWSFEVPKSWISVRPPRTVRKTSEQRRAEMERLALLLKRRSPATGEGDRFRLRGRHQGIEVARPRAS